ncbi:MAG: phosphatidylserine decarboxylase, partial [Pseudomonadota bacterium]|nr:phosphatidylserine decarboxylase [Pseudomonadota bacterium]
MFTALSVFPQYLLPKQAITELAGKFAKANAGRLTTFAIRRFVRHYRVDMGEAANPDIHSYRTFNEFFTRALLPEKRPIAQADYICPIDGAISQLGVIRSNQIIQAKGRDYTTT